VSGKERERDEDNEDDHEYGSWTTMSFMVGCFAEALIYRPRYLYEETLETHPPGAIPLAGNFN
jgi:hypothetical protein